MEALALSIIIPMTNSILTAELSKRKELGNSFAFMVGLLVSAPFSLVGWQNIKDIAIFLNAIIALLGCIFTIRLNKINEKKVLYYEICFLNVNGFRAIR